MKSILFFLIFFFSFSFSFMVKPLLIGANAANKAEKCGAASWYGEKHAGKKTANGELFNPSDFTAAHRTAKFGTLVTVWNRRNNRIVIVRVNDRGPVSKGRIIDISKSAAEELDLISTGVGNVCISY